MRTTLLLALALAGCADDDRWLPTSLWDPNGVVATTDGLYVPLPTSGGLTLVRPDGSWAPVDLAPGAVSRLVPTPDADRAVAFVERYRCDTDDRVRFVADCDDELLEVSTEIAVLDDGDVATSVQVEDHFNALAFSDDGAFAVAYLDFDEDVSFSGVVNLTAVVVIDLASQEAHPVPVGFAADRVLFTPDGERAVVLSQNRVAVLDLTSSPPVTEVVYPLTLDADHAVEPVGIELTPDGRYALISVQGAGDLYVLDLENRSVNMVSLSAAPAAMDVNPIFDHTVLVYRQRSVVDVLDHALFDLESIPLDEPMNRIARRQSFDVLYNDLGGHDVYRLFPDTRELVEYRLQNPAIGLHVAPTDEFAIALTRAEGGQGTGIDGYYDRQPGMEVLDLRGDADDAWPYLLEAPGVGVAFRATDTSLHALVLQERVEYLYELDLYSNRAEKVKLSEPPLAIGALPNDGPFYITHDNGLGLVSFLDPATGEVTEVAGFAASGLLEPTGFISDEED